jgi:DNA-binding response OmpR family regulator
MRPEEIGKILIVDDDPQVGRMLRWRLERRGYKCLLAYSGAQGVGLFQSEPVELVITDLNMSLGDGLTLIRAVRRHGEAPIIAISGFARQFLDRVRAEYDVETLDKPIDMKQLLRQIHRLRRKARGNTEHFQSDSGKESTHEPMESNAGHGASGDCRGRPSALAFVIPEAGKAGRSDA